MPYSRVVLVQYSYPGPGPGYLILENDGGRTTGSTLLARVRARTVQLYLYSTGTVVRYCEFGSTYLLATRSSRYYIVSDKWILGALISTCSCRPLTAGPISEQFRDLEVCSEISPAVRVSQEQVEKKSRKKETAETGPSAAGQPASACMQNSEFMHA